MTIDQLLADVSPLLPLQSGMVLSTQKHAALMRYKNHAANHFPAMLQALRNALTDVKSINALLAKHKLHPYTLMEAELGYAIAAASEVGE